MDNILDSVETHQEPTSFGGFWIRVLAYLIDSVLLWIANVILGMAFIGGYSVFPDPNNPAATGFATSGTLLSLALGWLYFALMESSKHQATLGKRALNLRVTGLNGERISFANATGRYFSKIVSALILCIGFIMVAFTAKKQGLHDMMAGTYVEKR